METPEDLVHLKKKKNTTQWLPVYADSMWHGLVFMGTCVWSLKEEQMLRSHFRLINHLELIKSKLIFIFN